MTDIQSRLRTLGLWDSAETIARNHGVSVDEMLGRRKLKSMVNARHFLWLYVRETFGYSYPQTAELFGVDHTTVMAAERKSR